MLILNDLSKCYHTTVYFIKRYIDGIYYLKCAKIVCVYTNILKPKASSISISPGTLTLYRIIVPNFLVCLIGV